MAAVLECSTDTAPVRRVTHWCLEGLRLWRRYPLRLFLLSLAPMVLEALLQLIPFAGVVLSKVFPLLLSIGVVQGLVEAVSTGKLRWSSPFRTWQHSYRWRALGLALLCGPLVFGVQQLGVAAIYGWPAVDAVLLGHVQAHPEFANRAFACLLILPGVPVAIGLGLAPMFVMFRNATPWRAVQRSLATLLRTPAAFSLYAGIQLLLTACMLLVPFGLLLLLPLLPWMTACWYVIWTDLGRATDKS
jgi:hypothetical protein